jgi:hypothetical protein
MPGWSFGSQHAPWTLSWGPLAGLTFLPRVRLDGFVVVPASWRVPPAAEIRRPGALARWRRRHQVPAAVQAGEGDELLYLDLCAEGAAKDLARFPGGRLFEIWRDFGALPDRGGRRVEAIAAVVNLPDGDDVERGRLLIWQHVLESMMARANRHGSQRR